MAHQAHAQPLQAFFEALYRELHQAIAQESAQTQALVCAVFYTAVSNALDEGLCPADAVQKACAVAAKVLFPERKAPACA